MAILYNAAIGNAASATSSTGSLNHAALVAIIINIAYIGTTSPNAVTVGGVSATLVTGSRYHLAQIIQQKYGLSGKPLPQMKPFQLVLPLPQDTLGIQYHILVRQMRMRCTNRKQYRGFSCNNKRDTSAGTTGRLLINCVGIANSANATG